jgi:hypothetical protein
MVPAAETWVEGAAAVPLLPDEWFYWEVLGCEDVFPEWLLALNFGLVDSLFLGGRVT